MTHLRLSEAARQVGISRPTIYKYAAEGRLSVTKDRLGHKQVELSELLRVFGELSTETQETDKPSESFTSRQQSRKGAETGNLSALMLELERTKAQLESKVVEAALLREWVGELKAQEQYGQEQRNRLMAMLEQSQRLLAAPTPAPRAPARRKVAVSAPAPVAPTRNPARKKGAVAAPVAVLAPVAPLAPGPAPARKKGAVLAPAAAALAKTSATKKSPAQKGAVSSSKRR